MTEDQIQESSRRLTYLINTVDWGGAQTGMIRLLSGLDLELFSVTVVCFRIDNEELLDELPDSIEVVELDINQKYQIHRLRPLLEILDNTDVLVCSMYHSSIVGTMLGRLKGVAAIFRWQHMTKIKSKSRIPFHKLTGWLSTQIIADCHASANFIERDLAIPSEQITILRLAGINLESFPSPQISPESPVNVGTVGRLQPKKNFDTIIKLASNFDADNYQFHIAGDGPMREDLEQKAENVEAIQLLGSPSQSEMNDFFQKMDIYVQPSKSEGLCITVLEAMASGLPVIASPVGGISQSVVDGKTGFLVEDHDIDTFETVIRKLGDDASLREKMGTAGRKRISNNYSRESLANEFTTLVKDALSDRAQNSIMNSE